MFPSGPSVNHTESAYVDNKDTSEEQWTSHSALPVNEALMPQLKGGGGCSQMMSGLEWCTGDLQNKKNNNHCWLDRTVGATPKSGIYSEFL